MSERDRQLTEKEEALAEKDRLLANVLNKENALEMYNFAHQKSSEKLKRAAFDLIKKVHPDVPEYLYDRPDVVNALIEAKLTYGQQQAPPAKKPRIGDE